MPFFVSERILMKERGEQKIHQISLVHSAVWRGVERVFGRKSAFDVRAELKTVLSPNLLFYGSFLEMKLPFYCPSFPCRSFLFTI